MALLYSSDSIPAARESPNDLLDNPLRVVSTYEDARDQLRREMAAAGEQMGNTALEGRQHLYYFVIGGGNVVAWGDYLRTYLSILKKNPRGLGQYRGGVGLSGGEAW